jgi:hypothetical protein
MDDGIYDNISITDYHANKTHYSATQLKMARHSLKEFEWYIKGKIKPIQGSHLDFGNAFELALLDKGNFEKFVAIEQDELWVRAAMIENPKLVVPRNSTTYKQLRGMFLTEHNGKYIVDAQGYESIEHMLESCHRDAVIQKLISNTEYQLSLFWTDESGLRMKTRPDICKRKKNSVVNLKTAEDGSPKAFSRDMANYDYPLQACIEIMGCLRTGLMESVDNYFWLVVEKTAPYNATIYEFAKEDIEWGMDLLRYVINKTKRAIDSDCFPGYSDSADNQFGILTAQIPLYYKM